MDVCVPCFSLQLVIDDNGVDVEISPMVMSQEKTEWVRERKRERAGICEDEELIALAIFCYCSKKQRQHLIVQQCRVERNDYFYCVPFVYFQSEPIPIADPSRCHITWGPSNPCIIIFYRKRYFLHNEKRRVTSSCCANIRIICVCAVHRTNTSRVSIIHQTCNKRSLCRTPPRSRMHEWDARLHAGTSPACTISLLDYIYIHTPHIIMWLGRKSNAKLPGNSVSGTEGIGMTSMPHLPSNILHKPAKRAHSQQYMQAITTTTKTFHALRAFLFGSFCAFFCFYSGPHNGNRNNSNNCVLCI